MTALPHSSHIAAQRQAYFNDLEKAVEDAQDLDELAEFRGIFKNSLAGFTVVRSFSRRQIPLLRCAGGVVRRLPMLVLIRQVNLAEVELRRFIELVVWFPYFQEHPVEWGERLRAPARGYVTSTDAPIAYCANRPLQWYVAYAKERLKSEPSGLARKALDKLGHKFAELSSAVHAATQVSAKGDPAEPFDRVRPSVLRKFQADQRAIVSAGCILIAAVRPGLLGKLNAVERAWFNWLVGMPRAQQVAGAPFGLSE